MNDWYNDPPEYEEIPECCETEMDFNEETCICKCKMCGKEIHPQEDPDPKYFMDPNYFL